jgi:hypothetical protein
MQRARRSVRARDAGKERYRRPDVSQLLACPFCRELFERTEAENCPDCDIPLQPLHRLPPSYEAVEEEAARWEQTRPEDEALPFGALGRGRGALLGVAIASLLVFGLAPWVSVSAPYSDVRSGYSLARGPIGLLWGGATAWLVSIALVMSRRSIAQMRGVRAILMVLSAMTGSEVALLLVMSPRRVQNLPVAYEWRWGLYAALALSVAGVALAARFGGARPAAGASPAAREPDAEPTVH